MPSKNLEVKHSLSFIASIPAYSIVILDKKNQSNKLNNYVFEPICIIQDRPLDKFQMVYESGVIDVNHNPGNRLCK